MQSKFKIFKTLTIGGITKENLLDQLAKQGVQFNAYAKILFDDPGFVVSEKIETVNLVNVSSLELGLTKPSYYNDIVVSAKAQGLKLCPLSLGAFLRLEHLDQAEGPYLHVASAKPKLDEEYPNGFYLRNLENVMWLRGYRASDDWEWPVDSEFVFRTQVQDAKLD